MKESYCVLIFVIGILSMNVGLAATYHITNSSYTFSPSELTINAGDTVVFALASIHNVVEVNQATWNADGTTPLPGGFSLPFGGGTIVVTLVGTHYYVCQPHASIGMKGTITVNSAAGVMLLEGALPTAYRLEQNYPNPFNPTTVIRYSLPASSLVSLKVFSVLGQEAATLIDNVQQPGIYAVTWDASNLPSGIYFYQLRAGNFIDTKKLTVLK